MTDIEACEQIRAKQTNGLNYDVTTEDIVARLGDWRGRCSFEVVEVRHDALLIRFETLPGDPAAFAREVYEFCPDTVDQHFGCIAELVDSGVEVPEAVRQFIDGVDLEDPDCGLVLLERSLRRNSALHLWEGLSGPPSRPCPTGQSQGVDRPGRRRAGRSDRSCRISPRRRGTPPSARRAC